MASRISKTIKNSSEALHAVVRDRSATLFEGEITGLSSHNEKGLFDILPRHANFISLIDGAVVLHHMDKRDTTIPVESGVLRVRENSVAVYIGFLHA